MEHCMASASPRCCLTVGSTRSRSTPALEHLHLMKGPSSWRGLSLPHSGPLWPPRLGSEQMCFGPTGPRQGQPGGSETEVLL